MVTASFRFYEELNDFLPTERRKQEFSCPCARRSTVKHMIEALGVPHTEVELILLNGESVAFDRLLEDGDRISVYPKFETFDIRPLLRVSEQPLRHIRFIADVHMGGLARILRMAGFDTLYEMYFRDEEIAAISARDERIVLTRDRALLMRREITHGCYVHALKPTDQWHEIAERLELSNSMQPFRLCLHCNSPLHPIDKHDAQAHVPEGIFARHERFRTCLVCRRVYWEGSHWERMRNLLKLSITS